MKHDKVLYNTLLLLIALNGFSCKKYLDEKPIKTQVEAKVLEDLQALLDDYSGSINVNTPGFGETSADDYFVPINVYNSRSVQDQEAYTWRLKEYGFVNDWSDNYAAVHPANYCLDQIAKIERTSHNALLWDNVKGSALFQRAYRFMGLIWEYGKAYDENTSQTDLGIVLRLTSDPSIPSRRSTVKECYERILLDAKESIVFLPENPQHVMRPSKAAAYGLLARTYLSMRRYDSAFKYANLSLQIKSELLNYNDQTQVTPSSLTPFRPFNNEIIYFTTQSGNYGTKNPTRALIDTSLYQSYNNDDLRKTVFFNKTNGFYSFKGNYNSASRFTLFSGLAVDEMYLTRAECHARDGRVTEAIDDLNTLLIKRWTTGTFVPLVGNDQQQTLNIILLERRKELLMRGLRWIDIKRLNKEGFNIMLERVVDQVYTLPPNDDKYALPLPIDIIEISGMPQNSGW